MGGRGRPGLSQLVFTAMLAAAVCGSSCAEPVRVADLIAQFAEARKQPASTAFDVADVTIDGNTKRSIIAHGQTRLTAHVTVPKHAIFRTSVALHPSVWEQPGDGVHLFVGVSDGQAFQTRASVVVDAFGSPADRRWREVEVNLEEFAGLTIDIVLNTRAGEADNATVQNDIAVWGTPVIIAR